MTMTDYELHSLQLLSNIASGISLHLSAMNPTMMDFERQQLEQDVRDWQKHLQEIQSTVTKLVTSELKTKKADEDVRLNAITARSQK